MNRTTVAIAFGAWVPIVLALFGLVGPRKAVLIAVFGAFLLLPRVAEPLPILEWLAMNKRVLTGLAILLGILVFDPRALIWARSHWADLPMAGFILLPILSYAANGFAGGPSTVYQVWAHLTEWGLPYLAGRLYFGDRDGPRALGLALVATGLLSIPIYAFEMVAGPRHYLAGLVYGLPPQEDMVVRLGGWRPEGFQSNGLEVATWMALSATVSAWLWLERVSISRRVPGWLPPLALTSTAIACRGVYGYLDLALGLQTIALTRLSKSRNALVALAMIPPLYMATRTTGLWDGRALVAMARPLGRPATVEYRLKAEDAYLKKVVDHGVVLGFGGSNSSIDDQVMVGHLYADGWWLYEIRSGGIVGLSAFTLGLFLVPAILALWLPTGRLGLGSPGALAWGLALFLLLHLFDSLHNLAVLSPTSLIGGSLVSLFLARKTIRLDRAPIDPAPSGWRPSIRAPLAVAIVVLALVEILGRLPRTTAPPTTSPSPASPSPKGP